MHRLVAICGLLLTRFVPIKCFAFSHHQIPTTLTFMSSPRPLSTGIHSITGSSAERSLLDMSVWEHDGGSKEQDPGGNKYSGLELWLDLRGTSLTPKTALELWDLEEHRCSNDYSEGFTNAPFVKCLVSSTEASVASPSQNSEDEINQNIDVLLIAEGPDDDDMAFIFQQSDSSTKSSPASVRIGRLLSLQASSSMPILPDPLPAMEIASNGQWIVLDTDGWKRIEEEERLRMALPLLELISSSASRSSGGGGIGLTCHTNNEVVKAVMFIQSMTNGGGSDGRQVRTKTLKSGIVILEDDTVIALPSSIQSATHHFAIVVPYDIELLRTAKLLFADKEIE